MKGCILYNAAFCLDDIIVFLGMYSTTWLNKIYIDCDVYEL